MKTIKVPIKESSYHVYIEHGLLSKIDQYIKDDCQYVIITDDGVPTQYIEQVKKLITIKEVLTFPHGEANKTMKTVEQLIDQLEDIPITRGDCLIALGGGIVGDVTGFVASIYLRGIAYYNIPTTLLSQIDASVGGKVGVNSAHAKNAIGQFKQPKAVFIDPDVLETLEERQFNNGVAELIKHALIKDESLFDDLLSDDFKPHLVDFIKRSITIKKDIVILDVLDHSRRQLLNFGHTFAHAIEKASHHDIFHGEAVAIGMALMSKKCDRHQDIIKLLKKFNLPTTTDYDFDTLKPYMKNDKKLVQSSLNLVLIEKIGQAYLKRGTIEDLKKYL